MKFFGFKGGVHPNDNKKRTENMAIEKISMPKMLYIPLLQHIGSPLEPIVKVGDKVLKGQKIADTQAFLSSPVHAPTSGTVKKIDMHDFTLMGKVKTVFLEPDGEETWCELETISNYKSADRAELLKKIRECGVVGLGGASFPTNVKLNPPADVKIDTLLLNGAECEPYLNSDNRIMLEQPEKVIAGIEILKHVLGVERAVIGIEDNKPEAIAALKKHLGDSKIEIAPLKTMYPQGGEKQLIKAILNREVPSGKLPSAVGVVVQNTTTAAAIYNAVVEGKPVIEKVVTVSGLAVKNPKNLLVPIGTQISEILNLCETDMDVVEKLVVGGPMMGMAQYTADVPVIKGTSGVLGLTAAETNPYKPRPCIVCGKCVDVCPMGLVPAMYVRLGASKMWQEMQDSNVMDCIECGCCAYICPSNRPLTESIKLGKATLRKMASR